MKTIVVIPAVAYDALLRQCPIEGPEYLMLKNGIVEGEGEGRIINIRCEESRADSFYDKSHRSPIHSRDKNGDLAAGCLKLSRSLSLSLRQTERLVLRSGVRVKHASV